MKKIVFVWSFIFVFFSIFAEDRVMLFDSAVYVRPDATLQVKERIHISNEGRGPIVHGIIREFPTKYKDQWGNTVEVGFNLKQVHKDGKSVRYRVEKRANGVFIYVGSPKVILPEGQHVYEISYRTTRQLGFFEKHDELYWNVTGQGWRLPIEKVIARINLPSTIKQQDITAEGYTGYQGQKGTNYRTSITGSQITIETTQPLLPRQGLTIVATWPKGFITPPTLWQKIIWFFKDNIGIFLLALLTIFLLLFYFWRWLVARKTKKPGTVIPLFEPPQGLSPAQIGFMHQRGYKLTLLGASIVDMAVNGLLEIRYTKKFLQGIYTLIAKSQPTATHPQWAQVLYDILFPRGSAELILRQSEQATMHAAQTYLSQYCKKTLGKYIQTFGGSIAFGTLVTFVGAFFGFVFIPFKALVFLYVAMMVLINALFAYLLKTYTVQGRKLQDKIDGFKMFLSTTEIERMKVIGTPPTKTPELYEKYLPYAMALGVEKQWSQQFSSVFARLQQEGQAYSPRWYRGPLYAAMFNPVVFSSNLSSSLNANLSRTIAAAARAPGTVSGAGGRGGAGGGGGGGGGGGW